ncbi:hypothetical protein V6N12_006188 [Hibiscus sabdariffa]|uniref:Uncharacterized protein n=1 Tax=Hibiscus sabdariffa TaxID=183260 RepID=A0ABR2EY43_9ROSI
MEKKNRMVQLKEQTFIAFSRSLVRKRKIPIKQRENIDPGPTPLSAIYFAFKTNQLSPQSPPTILETLAQLKCSLSVSWLSKEEKKDMGNCVTVYKNKDVADMDLSVRIQSPFKENNVADMGNGTIQRPSSTPQQNIHRIYQSLFEGPSNVESIVAIASNYAQ